MQRERHVPDKAGDVHIDKGGHQILAIKAIHDASVARNSIGKVLLEAGEELVSLAQPRKIKPWPVVPPQCPATALSS